MTWILPEYRIKYAMDQNQGHISVYSSLLISLVTKWEVQINTLTYYSINLSSTRIWRCEDIAEPVAAMVDAEGIIWVSKGPLACADTAPRLVGAGCNNCTALSLVGLAPLAGQPVAAMVDAKGIIRFSDAPSASTDTATRLPFLPAGSPWAVVPVGCSAQHATSVLTVAVFAASPMSLPACVPPPNKRLIQSSLKDFVRHR
jgi:hypothetical protein